MRYQLLDGRVVLRALKKNHRSKVERLAQRAKGDSAGNPRRTVAENRIKRLAAAAPSFAGRSRNFVRASGMALPFADDSFDALVDVFSPRPFDELLRVRRS